MTTEADRPFDPLGVEDKLDIARGDGDDAVVDVLIGALADTSGVSDDDIALYVDELSASCEDAGRERDGIPTLAAIAVGAGPDLRWHLTRRIARRHATSGDRDAAMDELRRCVAEQDVLPLEQRGPWKYAGCARMEIGNRGLWVAPLDADGVVAYARSAGLDPTSHRARFAYSDSLAGRDATSLGRPGATSGAGAARNAHTRSAAARRGSP